MDKPDYLPYSQNETFTPLYRATDRETVLQPKDRFITVTRRNPGLHVDIVSEEPQQKNPLEKPDDIEKAGGTDNGGSEIGLSKITPHFNMNWLLLAALAGFIIYFISRK